MWSALPAIPFEAADDCDIMEVNRNVAEADPDSRTEHTETRESGDAQDISDANRDNDKEDAQAKPLGNPSHSKLVTMAPEKDESSSR